MQRVFFGKLLIGDNAMYHQPQNVSQQIYSPYSLLQNFEKDFLNSREVIPRDVIIILNNGDHAWISDTAHSVSAQWNHDYDHLLNRRDLWQYQDVIFYKDLEQTQANNRESFAYCIVRHSSDCIILATYAPHKPCLNSQKLYEETVDEIEKSTYDILNNALADFCHKLPSLTTSRFANDERYRFAIIRNRQVKCPMPKLTHSELKVLYWASQGKTAEETAIILDLSKNTIITYRKTATEKLEAANITHAVYLAHGHRLIT